jgi:hypothetical protein
VRPRLGDVHGPIGHGQPAGPPVRYFARVDVDPAVSCRSDGLHVAQSCRLWIVTTRLIDVLRYQELSCEPQAHKGQPITPEQLTAVPANEASWDDFDERELADRSHKDGRTARS